MFFFIYRILKKTASYTDFYTLYTFSLPCVIKPIKTALYSTSIVGYKHYQVICRDDYYELVRFEDVKVGGSAMKFATGP